MTRYGPETLKCYLPLYWLHCALFGYIVLFFFFFFFFFFSVGKVCSTEKDHSHLSYKVCSTEKTTLICHIINNVDKQGMTRMCLMA